MSEWIEDVKRAYTERLKAHYLKQYVAYCREQPLDDRCEFGQDNLLSPEAIAALPPSVQDFGNTAEALSDSNYARVYQLKVKEELTYAARVTTDGDDGWLAIFDAQGKLLAAGQTYIEVVVWQATDLHDRPADLLDTTVTGFEEASAQTLWRQPLSEIEAEQALADAHPEAHSEANQTPEEMR